MNKTAPQFDDKLWFTTNVCCSGKHYLLQNPHTFPGRMRIYCPHKNISFNLSKSEIEQCSLEASYWIKGFLAGNEPNPPRNEQGDYLHPDTPQYQQWLAAIQQFPDTGIWVVSDRVCETCGDSMLPTQPGLKCPKCVTALGRSLVK